MGPAGPRPGSSGRGQEGAALGRARPGAQRGEERPLQRRTRRPGPRPRRPPRLREKHGGHADGGGSRFAQAGILRLSSGRAPRRRPAREGASQSLQKEMGARETTVREGGKKAEIGPGRLSGGFPVTKVPPGSDGRRGSRPPSPTSPPPHEAATVASRVEDQLRPRPEPRHNN
ncbi:unnamed protein product [Rangifer tarandus platyrhynchus]|uniref:Uncharacterized protein n=1 Tax=Rangifer tarandus platyrhynchus TaxID=3082113 RepID=A0ABN8ZKD9_RANTA|nr:unnamed protein product [Rangifer tarandus platyrhynchus]